MDQYAEPAGAKILKSFWFINLWRTMPLGTRIVYTSVLVMMLSIVVAAYDKIMTESAEVIDII